YLRDAVLDGNPFPDEILLSSDERCGEFFLLCSSGVPVVRLSQQVIPEDLVEYRPALRREDRVDRLGPPPFEHAPGVGIAVQVAHRIAEGDVSAGRPGCGGT